MTILTLILVNIHMVSRSGVEVARSNALMTSLESDLELTLDRITFALMAAESEQIEGPVTAPIGSSFVRFASVLGEDSEGNVVMSPTEEISWIAHGAGGAGGSSQNVTRTGGRVVWTENTDVELSREITWSNVVPILSKGEIGENAADDNGNGLFDEAGLSFARDGAQVQVFLTVERINGRGERLPVDRSLRIAPRN